MLPTNHTATASESQQAAVAVAENGHAAGAKRAAGDAAIEPLPVLHQQDKRRETDAAQPAVAAGEAAGEAAEEQQQLLKRHKASEHSTAGATCSSVQHPVHSSSSRSHIRHHHALDDDDEEPVSAGDARITEQQQQQQQQHNSQQHKRANKQQSLLSFQGDDDDDVAAAAEAGSQGVGQPGQQGAAAATGGMGQATAAKFKAEARQAAAEARFTFRPSGAAMAASVSPTCRDAAEKQQQRAGGLDLVDEDVDLRSNCAAAQAGLAQVHFGMAQARGARPYMEDRHCIVTALHPSSGAGGTAAPAADHATSPTVAGAAALTAAAAVTGQHQAATGTFGVQDGVGRSYAAIFDGHNGAGAAETAASKLHLLLARHPALRLHRGDPGPPAAVKQEEAAVGKALKAAFQQVDDLVLAVARKDGTRDGATALVVLRLGAVLYAAHAGDSRAVLCRDSAAHRLTEDHKPHLPQERQRIEGAGGRVDFQRCWRVVVEPRDGRPGSGLAVSRSLGDLDFKEPARFVECEPDIMRLPLLPHRDTFVILGSDGLWDVLSDSDAVHTAATALKTFALEQHGGASTQAASAAAIAAATQHYQQTHRQAAALYGRFGIATGAPSEPLAAVELPKCMVYSDAASTAAAEALLAESMRRGTMDNVTVIVMLLQWS